MSEKNELVSMALKAIGYVVPHGTPDDVDLAKEFEGILSTQGYAIVPVEPTEEMVKAAEETPGMRAVANLLVLAYVRGSVLLEDEEPALIQTYKAMLATSE